MAVTPEELATVYPLLYHMADNDAWQNIQKFGLLSTSALLDLYEITGNRRIEIEGNLRTNSVELDHPIHGRAVIRDQKPIHEGKLVAALRGCTAEEWYRLLNARVFFWLTWDRLTTLLCAREYANKPQIVLTLETLPLVKKYGPQITLSRMNSGNTQPIAHERGPDLFQRLSDYPFFEREKYGLYYQVVELAVDGGVPDITDYVTKVERLSCTRTSVNRKVQTQVGVPTTIFEAR